VRIKAGDDRIMKKKRKRGDFPLSMQKADGIGTQWNIPLSCFTKEKEAVVEGIRY